MSTLLTEKESEGKQNRERTLHKQIACFMNFKYDMKVIRHAGVDSRMIILDDQARQQMTRHFLIVTSMQRFAHHGLHCMPDEARDGQNVALK